MVWMPRSSLKRDSDRTRATLTTDGSRWRSRRPQQSQAHSAADAVAAVGSAAAYDHGTKDERPLRHRGATVKRPRVLGSPRPQPSVSPRGRKHRQVALAGGRKRAGPNAGDKVKTRARTLHTKSVQGVVTTMMVVLHLQHACRPCKINSLHDRSEAQLSEVRH